MGRFGIAVCLLGLAGCTSLDAVGSLSSRLVAASAGWTDVGAEFAASCAREATLNPALTDCTIERDASAGLAAADDVLTGYFIALGDAANDPNFTVKPGLDAASAAVGRIPDVDAAQVKAVSGLVALLARLATDALREKALHDLIEHGAPPAQTVVRGLDTLVVPRLGRRLATERLQLDGQFGRLILAQHDAAGSTPSALCIGSGAASLSGTGFLLALEYCRRAAVLDRRMQALDDYRASLAAADAALTELRSAKARLKAKDLAGRLFALGIELDAKAAAVRKAFG